LRDVYRLACSCGQYSSRWSVSEGAAIRLWNEIAMEKPEPSWVWKRSQT
jgi:hypothetical protein